MSRSKKTIPVHPVLSAMIVTGKAKLAKAIAIVMHHSPFHGHVLAGWRELPDLTIGTMGVTWACGGIQLLWDPVFVDRISNAELAGVLLHEVHHVVLRHPFMFPEQANPTPDFDLYAAIVAEEVTVNEFVTLPMPEGPMRLEDFVGECPALAPFQSTRKRYELLYDRARAQRDHDERTKADDTDAEHGGSVLDRLRDKGLGQLPDNHEGWGSFQQAGSVASLAVAVATSQALAQHGDSLPPELKELIRGTHELRSVGAGTQPGGSLEILAGTAQAKLPWQTILRRLLAVDYDAEVTYLRAPRRFPGMAGVLPGRRLAARKLRILAAIDTSGSMSAEDLDEIAAELRVMSRMYDVSVVEFDTAIQRKYRLESIGPGDSGSAQLKSMMGRGGTSFYPVFAPETLAWAEDGGELSGIVCFTDGCGLAPENPPKAPVIWVLTGAIVDKPASWGTTVIANPEVRAQFERSGELI